MKIASFTSKVWGPCKIMDGGCYPDGSKSLIVYGMDDDPSPISILTVNLEIGPLKEGYYLIKTWSENEPLTTELLELGIFEDTGERIPTGYVQASIWKLKERT